MRQPLMKRERLGARITLEQKALLQRAADLTGRSLTDFVVASAQAAAEETIRRYEIIQLTARDSERLAQVLLNPPAPNEKLLAAAQEYRAFIGERA